MAIELQNKEDVIENGESWEDVELMSGRSWKSVEFADDDVILRDEILKDENCIITEERPLVNSEISWGKKGDQTLFIYHPVSQVFCPKAKIDNKKLIMCQGVKREDVVVGSDYRNNAVEDICTLSKEGKEHLLFVKNIWLDRKILLQELKLPTDLILNETFNETIKFDGAICHINTCLDKKDFPHVIILDKNMRIKVDCEVHVLNEGEMRTYGAKPFIIGHNTEKNGGDWIRKYFNPKYPGYEIVEIVKKEDIDKNGTIQEKWNSRLKNLSQVNVPQIEYGHVENIGKESSTENVKRSKYDRFAIAIKDHISWIKENISGSRDRAIRVKVGDFAASIGEEFVKDSPVSIYLMLKYILFGEGIRVDIDTHVNNKDKILVMRERTKEDILPPSLEKYRKSEVMLQIVKDEESRKLKRFNEYKKRLKEYDLQRKYDIFKTILKEKAVEDLKKMREGIGSVDIAKEDDIEHNVGQSTRDIEQQSIGDVEQQSKQMIEDTRQCVKQMIEDAKQCVKQMIEDAKLRKNIESDTGNMLIIDNARIALKTESEQIESKRATLKTESEQIESKRATLNTESEQIESKRATLNTESEQIESKRATLKTESEQIESKRATLKTESEQIESKIVDLNDEMVKKDQQIEKLYKKIENLEISKVDVDKVSSERRENERILMLIDKDLQVLMKFATEIYKEGITDKALQGKMVMIPAVLGDETSKLIANKINLALISTGLVTFIKDVKIEGRKK